MKQRKNYLKEAFNKDAYKIYSRLNKDTKKNKKKLLNLCKKYVETEDDDLLIDIEYYADTIFDDIQDMMLIHIASGVCPDTEED